MQQETNPEGNDLCPSEPVMGCYEVDGGKSDGAFVYHRYYPETGETVYTQRGGQWIQIMPWDTVPIRR